MKTPKEKFDSMQRMYDNAAPPEDMLEAREEARINEINLLELDIFADLDALHLAVLKFLTHVNNNDWPEEYQEAETAFNMLIESYSQHELFKTICNAAANWEASNIADEIFKDK